MPQKSVFDVVVVGSGPAGATTARAAANGGLRVLLVDKKQELGVPIQCSGAVSAHALAQAGIVPDPEFAPAPVFGFATYDATGNMTTLDYRTLKPELHHNNAPLGYVVDRRRFDRHLLKLAEQAGAQAWLKTAALGYTSHSNGAVSVQLNRMGRPVEVRARVIVGADGVQSQVGKWAGLPTRIKLSDIASCFQLVVDRVETNGLLEIVTGHRWAPGGYAWIFPKGHGYAEVGLGIIRTMTGQDARHHLDDFCRNSFMAPRLRRRRIVEVQGGGVPLAAPLKRPFADNVILVGDAARHVNPITGGGIHTALRGGMIAGNFLARFLSTGQRPTAKNLAPYQQLWFDELGHAMQNLYNLKRRIFRQKDVFKQDQLLHQTLAGYFHPASEFRKV